MRIELSLIQTVLLIENTYRNNELPRLDYNLNGMYYHFLTTKTKPLCIQF